MTTATSCPTLHRPGSCSLLREHLINLFGEPLVVKPRDVASLNRYLEALLADLQSRPWHFDAPPDFGNRKQS